MRGEAERQSRAAADLCGKQRVVGGHLSETFTKQREWPPTRREQEGAVLYILLRRLRQRVLLFFFWSLLNFAGTRHGWRHW